MAGTGRISTGIKPEIAEMLFGTTVDEAIDTELGSITQVDRAHLLMLAEQGLVADDVARTVLRAIDELRATDYAALRGKQAGRGLFLLYESALPNGGVLQTGRSRNDLNATVLLLRLRDEWLALSRAVLGLQAVLIERAAEFADVVMPAYTHYQPAVPITYGHWLAGVAFALGRDAAAVLDAGRTGLARCPLGAGSAGGTSLPIDPARTAELLGFDHPVAHSLDAVASRDVVLRLLAAASIAGVTLSRLTADLLPWLGGEYGFLTLPDDLVGSSSLMPQKRNPFVLEQVQGRTTAAVGAFTAAAGAMHATPFTNSIAVGTEAVSHVWRGLRSITDAMRLATYMVDGARPVPERMLQRAVEGYTTATALADRLVVGEGKSFRDAHHEVGSLINQLEAAGTHIEEDGLDPASVVAGSKYGGGPAPSSIEAGLELLRGEHAAHVEAVEQADKSWRAAEADLDRHVRRFVEGGEQ
ncbi:MAG TPA: argininosuccinate lyase [Acidimicrobiales bacterium]|nr:argininosuccinate lyase [Acidimicrobiales bacterium]